MIHTGDCIEVMATMPADSVDAVVTDPPYGLGFMGKEWDSVRAEASRPPSALNPAAGTAEARGAYPRTGKGPLAVSFAGQAFQAWCEQWGREALRVTKPGGYLLAFGGTRTHHRLVCGLEDAGWIIRDELDWIYASGFPKGKANLKPAHEPIVLARKPGPLRPLGIDATRIGTADGFGGGANGTSGFAAGYEKGDGFAASQVGRWPSNLLLSDPELFDEPNPYVIGAGPNIGSIRPPVIAGKDQEGAKDIYGQGLGAKEVGEEYVGYGDSGGYSRFFLVPKSSRSDREPVIVPDGHDRTKRFSTHPTQKPTDLMAHLIKLVTPTDGVILDPFLGSGSTAIAAERLGVKWIGIEKEPEYVAIAEARLNGTQRGMGLDVPAPTSNKKARPRETEGRDLTSNRQDELIWASYQPDEDVPA